MLNADMHVGSVGDGNTANDNKNLLAACRT